MKHVTIVNSALPPLKLRGGARRGYEQIIKKVFTPATRIVRCPKNATVSVVFIGDAMMRKMNRTYRGKDKTTNVLSFHGDGADLGDIFISLPEAKREAKKYGWSARYSVARLALHGFLHLLGYDHEKEKEAKRMEGIEKKVLKEMTKPQ